METTPQQPEAPEAARASIATLQADPAWTAAYLAGDSAKVAEFTRLHSLAHPEAPEGQQPAADAPKPGEASPEHGDSQQLGEDALDVKAPDGPWEYDLGTLSGNAATDSEISEMHSISQSLFEAGVPTFAVGVVQGVAQRNCRGGAMPSDAELEQMDASCRAELQRKYGEQGAKALIADAHKYAMRAVANPLIAEYLDATGAGSDPFVVETLARLERSERAKRGL